MTLNYQFSLHWETESISYSRLYESFEDALWAAELFRLDSFTISFL